ncbi:hypothetical protein FRB94_010470 [Tulasnella sp. JGI-2019a]|nr:hypothetical protein FRB94_010470 [Tulasnella sp. JGI-2019a]
MEFERYGRLTRCDIPVPHRNQNGAVYAFVEYKSERDADEAYHSMHGHHFNGHRLSVQWAKNPPSNIWRFENKPSQEASSYERSSRRRSRSPRRDGGGGGRSPPPDDDYRRRRSPIPEEPRSHHRDRDRDRGSTAISERDRDSRRDHRGARGNRIDDRSRRSRSPDPRRAPLPATAPLDGNRTPVSPVPMPRGRTPLSPRPNKDIRLDRALTPPYD